MDHPVNRRVNNPPLACASTRTAPRQSFFEHLGAFFRRNLYFPDRWLRAALLQDIFGTHGVLAMRRSQAEARKIQQEINQLDDENKKLQNHVKDLKSDPGTMEGIARDDFGLARPGELVPSSTRSPARRPRSAPATTPLPRITAAIRPQLRAGATPELPRHFPSDRVRAIDRRPSPR